MVRTLRLTGDFEVVDGAESVSDRVTQRLRFVRGEWFANQNIGTPYLEDLLGRAVDNETLANALASEAAGVEGVASVRVISFTSEGRDHDVRLEIDDEEGGTQEVEVRV